MQRFRRWTGALIGLAIAVAASSSRAFPDRPIRLVVPSSAGGGADAVGRAFADQLTRRFGQPVIVENVPGASGAIAARAVSRARPDGYTLMVGVTSELVIAPLLMPDAGYSHASFTPIALLIRSPLVLLARAELRATSFDELSEHARNSAQRLSIGIGGRDGLGAFAANALTQAAGIDLAPIPYQGANAAMLGLMRGELDLAILPLSVVQAHLEGNRIKPIALLSQRRLPPLPSIPSVPAIGESRHGSGIDVQIWAALVGPADMPSAIVEALNQAVREIVSDPLFASRRRQAGEFVAPAWQPGELEAFIEREHRHYSKLIGTMPHRGR